MSQNKTLKPGANVENITSLNILKAAIGTPLVELTLKFKKL
jgi:hypothetical protein